MVDTTKRGDRKHSPTFFAFLLDLFRTVSINSNIISKNQVIQRKVWGALKIDSVSIIGLFTNSLKVKKGFDLQ